MPRIFFKKRFFPLLLMMTFFVYLSSGTGITKAYTAATLLKLKGTPTYIHGGNLAWLDGAYDHDIGINPLHPSWGCSYNSAHMANYLADMKNMNLNVVRIWLFEGLEGLQLDANDNVIGVDSTFLTNLDNVVSLASQKGVTLYFTFLSGLKGIDSSNPSRFFPMITDTTKMNNYLNNAVSTVVNRYKGNSTIFAYDVMNECESDIVGDDGNRTSTGVTWAQMQNFIAAVANKVHSLDPGRLVTSTSGWHDFRNIQKGYFKNLGLDFYDFHSYTDIGYLPNVSVLKADKPVIVGEYGQGTNSWNDTIQNNADTNYMNNARDKGYAGELVWTYGYPGSTEVHSLINSNNTWRPVCTTLKNFNPNSAPTVIETIKNNFEGSTEGWAGSNITGGPWSVNEWAINGSYTLKADINLASGANYTLSKTASDNFSGKKVLTATVKHASWGTYGTEMKAKLYIQCGSSWTWYDSGEFAISGSTPTTLVLDLTKVTSGLDQIRAIGVMFLAGSGSSGGSSIYVDYVTIQ